MYSAVRTFCKMRGWLSVFALVMSGVGSAGETYPFSYPLQSHPSKVDAVEPFSLQVVATVPMIYDPPYIPTPLVRLSINGKPPALFVLSSGAPWLLLIDKDRARQFGLSPERGSALLSSVHLVNERGEPAKELGIPVAFVEALNLSQIDLGLDVAGIIGANFFAALPVELDFREKVIRLYKNTIEELRKSDDYLTVKLSRADPQAWVHTVKVLTSGGRELEMTISTGSWCSSLAERDVKQVELAEIASTPLPMGVLDAGASTIVSTFLGRLDWMSIGGAKVNSVPCIVKLNSPEQQSRLGVDILALFGRVVLDFKSGHMLLRRPGRALSAHTRGISGLTIQLDRAQRRPRVVAVAANSAASRAGFLAGDIVLSINERSVETLAPATIQLGIDGYAGISQRVKILRGDTVREIVLTPESPFASNSPEEVSSSNGQQFGFDAVLVEMDERPGGSSRFLLVTKVSENAKQAGLRVGDKILSINGVRIGEVSDKSGLHDVVDRSDELTIVLRRPGEYDTREVKVRRQHSLGQP